MGSGALARRETLAVFCNHARRCSASALRYWYGGAKIFCSAAWVEWLASAQDQVVGRHFLLFS
jgi:hypothetical protein